MQNRSESNRKAVLDTTLFCIGIFFLYADQNLLAPNLSKVAEVIAAMCSFVDLL